MVDVVDLEALRIFYLDVLGATERHQGDVEKELAMFELGEGRVIEFFQEEKLVRPPVELSLEIDDVQSLWESIQDKAEIIFPLRHNSWGDTSFCLKDPAGCSLVFFTSDLAS